MSSLHAYFAHRNQHAFQRTLEAARHAGSSSHTHSHNKSHHNYTDGSSGGPGTSGGKSWTKSSGMNAMSQMVQHNSHGPIDINARDWLGRTVLHLACAATDNAAVEYVRMVLAHPGVNVNLQDRESMWTALHRALYHGNLASAILLLQRSDTDHMLKDLEGYTAFDLYNSTVEDTKPPHSPSGEHGFADLYTWGANRNATLGLGDDKDRTYPDQIDLRPSEAAQDTALLTSRLLPLQIRDIVMSKLHTVVLTAERRNNVRVCGFGSGGRLGPTQHTQYALMSLGGFGSDPIVSAALGQDHTLVLTRSGEVYSWGLNRFVQLGYMVEASASTPGNNTTRGLGGDGSSTDEAIQSTPKKVPGLKNQVVRGVAASKNASACWTAEHVYTWGTNVGQLGYDRVNTGIGSGASAAAGQGHGSIQVSPRVVTKIPRPAIMVAMAEHAMCCLLESGEVLCFANERMSRINFPVETFPSEITPYRPPQSVSITKVTASAGGSEGGAFAALSSKGEVFTFTIAIAAAIAGGATPSVSSGAGMGGDAQTRVVAVTPGGGAVVRPQRVWSLRKKFSAATDVVLGADGALIICTGSGHVYVRAKGGKGFVGPGAASASAKGPKFSRVAGLQRVVRVAANPTGGYGALHVEYRPQEISLVGNEMTGDVSGVQPWLKVVERVEKTAKAARVGEAGAEAEDMASLGLGLGGTVPKVDELAEDKEKDEEGEDEPVLQDIKRIRQLCELLQLDKKARAAPAPTPSTATGTEIGAATTGRGIFAVPVTKLAHGADIIVQVGSAFEFPAHRLVAAMRSPVLRGILGGTGSGRAVKDKDSKISIVVRPPAVKGGLPRLVIDGCRPVAALLLMTYLYTDDVPAVWDRRVGLALEAELTELGIRPAEVKRDLHQLARLLELPRLDEALEPLVKRVPVSSLLRDVKALHTSVGSKSAVGMPQPDVLIKLADREVKAYSLILRARSPLFAAFFDDDHWTNRRWTNEGPERTITVNFSHLKWRAMDFVLRHICAGEEEEMFDSLESIQSVDELIDLLFEVKAAANELHIARLMLVCSKVLMRYVNTHNVAYILNEASYLHSATLVHRLHAYIAVNMETMLEGRLLDDLFFGGDADLIRKLANFVRERQREKSPVARSDRIVRNAMMWFGDWLELQDIPVPIVPSGRMQALRDGVKISPPNALSKSRGSELAKPPRPSLPVSAIASPTAGDEELFTMDDVDEQLQQISAPRTGDPALAFTPVKKKVSGTWKTMPATPKSDLKSIMEQAQTSPARRVVPGSGIDTPPASSTPLAPSTPRAVPRQLSQSNWRQQQPLVGATVGDSPVRASGSIQRATSGGSPWPTLAPTPNEVSGPASPPPSLGRSKTDAYPALGAVSSRQPPASPARPSAPTTPGLGPVISPMRQASSSRLEPRRSSTQGGKVWAAPVVQPIPAPITSTPGLLSFADIQAMQSQQALPVEKDKRTLREIQDEERARQEENDFLKWWAEEEARTKRELDDAIVASNNANAEPNASEKKRRKPKKPKDLRDVGNGSSSTAALVPGPSTGSADTSPTTVERPQKPRRPPRQPQNGTQPRDDSNVSVQAPAMLETNSPRRGGGPRARGSTRGARGGQSRPAVQAM